MNEVVSYLDSQTVSSSFVRGELESLGSSVCQIFSSLVYGIYNEKPPNFEIQVVIITLRSPLDHKLFSFRWIVQLDIIFILYVFTLV